MHYAELAELYAKLEANPKRLEKTAAMAAFLKRTPDSELAEITLLLQARAFPSWEKQTLGIASKVMLKTLASSLGMPEKTIENEWVKHGDLGVVAQTHALKRNQAVLFREPLTTQKVANTLKKLAVTEGAKSVNTKLKLLSELFSQAEPVELKYLVRTVLEDLRVGVADGTLRDAIVWAFFPNVAPKTPTEEIENREEYKRMVAIVQGALDRTSDFGKLAILAKQGEDALSKVALTIGVPVKVMLATREPTMDAALARAGSPAQLEYKYDGFRIQVHKHAEKVTIFTRRLENVTNAFPDIVALANKYLTHDCILDGEAIGLNPDTKQYVPFQEISQRIRRKYNIVELSEKLPVHTVFFDVLLWDDTEMLDRPLSERRALLEKNIPNIKHVLGISQAVQAEGVAEAKAFFAEAKTAGCEGVMVKRLESKYQPGSRVGDWIKQKEIMEALDLVIVGAEWGEGKRSGWFTSFELACRDELGEYRTIGRVGTGLKELAEEGLSFGEVTELLKAHIEYEDGKLAVIHPAIVVEVAYEEIQLSPSYTSGFALRFPRIVRNRTDERGPEDASTMTYVEQLFSQQ